MIKAEKNCSIVKIFLKYWLVIMLLIGLSTVADAQSWTQMGQDIDGKAADDYSGSSVSLSADGSIVAVGAWGNDNAGADAGNVRVYKNNNGIWTQIGKDIDGEAEGDCSGYSLCLSSDGSVVAIGAPGNDGNSTDSGHVRIYKNIGENWTQIGEDIDGGIAGFQLDIYMGFWSGRSISLNSDGSIVAIGTPYGYKGSLSRRSGYVRVYKNNGKNWIQTGENIDCKFRNTDSGYSVSLSSDGSIVAVGAPDKEGGESGSVQIYKNNDGIWKQIGKDIDGEAKNDCFGYSVSLSADGSIVAIGAVQKEGYEGTVAGYVKIYQNNNGTWAQVGKTINGEAGKDKFGISVTISRDGSVVAVGAALNDGNGYAAGHVRLFKNISGLWTQIGKDIDGEATEDLSGRAVSLNADGTIVAIGAWGNDGSARDAGHVRVYQNNQTVSTKSNNTSDADKTNDKQKIGGTWWQTGKNIYGKSRAEKFGASTSLNSDGSVIAIGSPYNPDNGYASGCVNIFQNKLGTWTQLGNTIQGGPESDELGFSVSMNSDGSVVAIGAPDGDDRGSVKVYKIIDGIWTLIGNNIKGESWDDEFGYSVSLNSDGTVVAIGAPKNEGNGERAGHVRIYKNILGVWTQIGTDIDGQSQYDEFGSSVSLSSDGSSVAIGAPDTDYGGSVKVYKIINGIWTQIGHGIDGEGAKDEFGFSVSLSSDGFVVAIGARLNDGNGDDAGHVRIYKNQSGVWIQIGDDIDGEAKDYRSGRSVSLNSDGSIVAIGDDYGHVKIYKNNGDVWKQIGENIDGSVGSSYSDISVSLSSDGFVVAVGCPRTHTGRVEIFENKGENWIKKVQNKSTATTEEKLKNINPHIKKGLMWKNKGKHDKAIEEFNKAIQLNPNNAAAYVNRGEILCRERKYDDAIQDFSKAIQLDPDNADVYCSRGWIWKKKRKYDKAIEDYNKAIKLKPNDADIYNSRGLIWIKKDEYDKAIQDFDKAIQIDSGFGEAYYNRGFVWEKKGKDDKAFQDFIKAIKLDNILVHPKFASTYVSKGLAWEEKGEYDKAIDELSKSIQLNPNETKAYWYRGIIFNNKHEYEKAIQDYNELIRLEPNSFMAYINRGLFRENKGNNEEALQDYTKVIQLDSGYIDAYKKRSKLWEKMENFEMAIIDLNKIIQLDPNNVEAYNDRGSLLVNYKNDHEKAIQDFTKVIQFNSKDPDAYFNRAVSWYNKGNYINAIEDFNQAIRFGIDNVVIAHAHLYRGLMFKNRGEYALAISDYDKAIEIDPKFSPAYSNKGVAYEQQKKYKLALKNYDKAIELNPEDPSAYNNIAWIYATAEDKQYRNGPKAIVFALKSFKLEEGEGIGTLDTLGAAYVENKQYDKAIESYEKVIEKGKTWWVKRYQKILKEKGYYSGTIDGIDNQALRNALRKFIIAGNYL